MADKTNVSVADDREQYAAVPTSEVPSEGLTFPALDAQGRNINAAPNTEDDNPGQLHIVVPLQQAKVGERGLEAVIGGSLGDPNAPSGSRNASRPGSAGGVPQQGYDTLAEPLLPTHKPYPAPGMWGTPGGPGSDVAFSGQRIPRGSDIDDVGPSAPLGLPFQGAVAHLTNAILGVGMVALPKAVGLLGWPMGLGAIIILALLAYTSLTSLTRISAVGGHGSYVNLVRDHLGATWTVILELALVFNCFVLLLVYYIVIGDLTVGDAAHEGGLLFGWEFDRPTVLAVLSVVVIAPILSFRRMNALAGTSTMGFLAIMIWCLGTLCVALAAMWTGNIKHMNMHPHLPGAEEGPWWKSALAAGGVLPVMLVAFTSHMAVHHVVVELAPQGDTGRTLIEKAVGYSIGVCTLLYLIITVCSSAIFGQDLHADVLMNFTLEALKPIVGDQWAHAIYLGVRISFLVSLIASFPMQMYPLRDALWRLLFKQPLQGPGLLMVTYGLLFAVYSIASKMNTIWGPLVLVGSTAGPLIALILPGLVLASREEGSTVKGATKVGVGALLITVGVVLGVTGLCRLVLLPSPIV